MRKSHFTLLALLATTACARWAQEPRFGSLVTNPRPFDFAHNIELFEVSNGLRVALIHDERTNLATIDVRYAVGAAEDPAGRAGMAHLAEHLLFELRAQPGGPTLGDELGQIALDSNADTSWDRTHYTATVPVEHLPKVMALEARRMRARCEELDEPTFRRERDVVLAEEKQRYGPLSATIETVLGDVYGGDHPYARAIGAAEIAHATRDEVCAFVASYYTPARAYVVITGPFDRAATQALIGRTFGGVAARATTAPRRTIARPRLDGRVTRHAGAVEHPTAMVFFAYPGWGADGVVAHEVARQVLAASLAAAADERDWVLGTSVYTLGGARAPVLVAEVQVSAAAQLDAATQLVYAQGADLVHGVSGARLQRVVAEMELAYIASWDDLARRGGWIADFLQYTQHTWFMLREMGALAETDWPTALVDIGATLAPTASHVAYLTPSGGAASAVATAVPAATHDLTPWRAPVDPADALRPLAVELGPPRAIDVYQLANGLTVQLAPDPASPLVDARLIFPVGSAHEPADRPHLATAAASMLGSDNEGYYQGPIAVKLDWATSRGTELDSDVGETSTTFSARGGALFADWHVWYLSWWLDQGRYNRSDLAAMHRRARALARAEDDEIDGATLAFRTRLFGAGHPYATPPPARGAAFLRLGGDDLDRWRRDHYRARGATLVVSGKFDVAAMKAEIDELFGPWSGAPPAPLPTVPPTRPAAGPSWLADADADARQTSVLIGFATQSDPDRDEAARAVLAAMLEDELRVVREGMGATYGLQVGYAVSPAGGALLLRGRVDEGQSGGALARVLEILTRLRDDPGGQRAGFVRARKQALAEALGRRGGASAVAADLEREAIGGRSVAHGRAVARQIAALTLPEVAAVATADLAQARMVVLVRGKYAAVAAAFAALQLTPEWPVEPTAAERAAATLVPSAPVVEAPAARAVAPTTAPAASAPPATTTTAAPARPATTPAAPPPRPVSAPPAVGAPLAGRAATRLYVGSAYVQSGPSYDGLFLGDRHLTLDEFLRLGGRADILTAMTTRRWLRRGVMVSGILTAAVGLAMAVSTEDCPEDPGLPGERGACLRRVSEQKVMATFVAILGLGAMGGAALIGSGRPTTAELRIIAGTYNQRAPAPAASTASSVRIMPVAVPRGGGLALSAWF